MKYFKKLIKQSDLWVTITIIIGILIVVNLLSYQLFVRFDLTENKDFSISKVSKKAIQGLDDIVNIKVYFSKNLPSRFIVLRQEVGDILNEYENYSDNKVRIEFLDPSKIEEYELYALGIPALQFNILEKDKYQVVKGYLGMSIEYGDKKEIIPVIESSQNLEYQITLAIKKVISNEMSTIGFVGDSEKYSIAINKLEEIYKVKEIDLENDKELLNEIDTLVMAGIQEDLGEKALKNIDEFIINNGNLLTLVDGVNIEDGLIPIVNEIDLIKFFENYGIKINNNLVLDHNSGVASFNSGFFTMRMNYPFWPKIVKEGFNKNIASVANLEMLFLPWVSSLEEIGKNEFVEIKELVKTSSKSWVQYENFDLNPQQNFSNQDNLKSITTALSLNGKINSVYSEKVNNDARIIVIGDSDFAQNNFINQFGENLIFFQNLVDSLSLDEDLINIRSKGIAERQIKELSENEKILVRYINVFGVTVLVIIFGMVRYYLRRRRS